MKADKVKKPKAGKVSGSGTISIDRGDWETGQERKNWNKGGGGLQPGTYIVEVASAEIRESKAPSTLGEPQVSLKLTADAKENDGKGGTTFFDATFASGPSVKEVIILFEAFDVADQYTKDPGGDKPVQISIPPESVVESWVGTKLRATLTAGKPYEKNGETVEGRPRVRIDPLEDAPAGVKKAKKSNKAAK